MDILESAERSGFIPEASREAFINAIGRTDPPPRHYIEPHPTVPRLQGDLFASLPFPLIKTSGEASVKHKMAAVLNNSCDLQPGRSGRINIALALDFTTFKEAIERERSRDQAYGYLRSAQENQIAEILYIDSCPGCKVGLIVFLDRIATIPSGSYDRAVSEGVRLASLSQHGFYYFLIKLTNLFARAESQDIAREFGN